MGAQLAGSRRTARGDGRRRPRRNAFVLLPGCERVRPVRRDQQHDVPRAEREHGDPHGPAEGGSRSRRLRGARPEDRVREDELSVVPAIQLQLSNGIRPVVIERWLRVCGDGLRRIAETETDWWRSDVEQPLLEGGMSTVQMLEAQAEFGSRISPLMEQVLVAIYSGQQEHAWSQSALEDVEDALERAGLLSRLHRPPAVCFLDLTGFTRLTEERGDEAAAELAETLAAVVRRRSQEHGGRLVKWLGDGVMFYFQDPGEGVLAALDMVEGAATGALPPARVGIDAGPVIFQEGDYFGRTVNIAARIAEYARPGEVLVSQAVVDAADGTPVTFTGIGAVELKGLSGALLLHSAHRAAWASQRESGSRCS